MVSSHGYNCVKNLRNDCAMRRQHKSHLCVALVTGYINNNHRIVIRIRYYWSHAGTHPITSIQTESD